MERKAMLIPSIRAKKLRDRRAPAQA